jgi:hypothetical protein
MAHVKDMLDVVCHTPLLEESSIASIPRVRAVPFRMHMNTPQTAQETGMDWMVWTDWKASRIHQAQECTPS